MEQIRDFEKPARMIAPQREAKSNDTCSILPTIIGGKNSPPGKQPLQKLFSFPSTWNSKK